MDRSRVSDDDPSGNINGVIHCTRDLGITVSSSALVQSIQNYVPEVNFCS